MARGMLVDRARQAKIAAMSASHNRATDWTKVSSTVCRSKVERLMTLSTSAVGGLLLQRFAQLVEQPSVLDSNDGLLAQICSQARPACR